MESYNLDLYPNRDSIHFALFQNITNIQELKKRFMDQDETLGLCLINASLVFNKFHVLLAVNRAIHDEQTTKIKTSNIHSEIAFGFGTNNNIAKTLKSFGLNDDTKNIIVIRFGSATTEEAESFIKTSVQGDLVSFDQLSSVRDLKAIKKAYGVDEKEKDEDKIISLVTSAMALKGHQ